jgi:hypothetical protein
MNGQCVLGGASGSTMGEVREKFGIQLLSMVNEISAMSENINNRVAERLSSITLPEPKTNCFPGDECKDIEETWPEFLETLRSNLKSIRRNLQDIGNTIERVEV